VTDASSAQRRFLWALQAIREYPDGELAALDSELKAALLSYGSHTEDNVAATQRLGIHHVRDGHRGGVVGLALESGPLLSHVLNLAEGSEIPKEVQQECPQVRQADWDAILRLATLIMTALEGDPVTGQGADAAPHHEPREPPG
jgi:hypothetical protein